MKKGLTFFLLSLIICSLVLVNMTHLGKAQTGTNVTGIISSDTTWTQANSPYTFTGPVAINIGVSLTIQSGVTVNIGTYFLQVNGTLRAIGSSTSPIYVNSSGGGYSAINFMPSSDNWNEQTSAGSIIQNAVINYTQIFISNTSPKIDNNNFNYTTIYVDLGSPIISNNNIIAQNYGISISNFMNGNYFSNYKMSPVISNNSLTASNSWNSAGIFSVGNATIINNSITGFTYGIASGGLPSVAQVLTDNDTIIGNLIYRNNGDPMDTGYGIWAYSKNSVIENNTVIENPIGIGVNYPSQIMYNNIYGNQYNVYCLSTSANISATYNWWGTTDTQAINQTIYDFKNNFNYGNISFLPFLTVPNPMAPPEIPSFTISASAQDGGDINPNGIFIVNIGTNLTFDMQPYSANEVADVLVNGSSKGPVDSYTFYNINASYTILVTFTPIPTPYTTTITHVGLGAISPPDGQIISNLGSTITLAANPASNYAFMCWLENGTLLSTSNPYSYSPTNSFVITAVFYDPSDKSTPSSSPTPTPTPTPSPSPSPIPTASPTQTPTQTASPTSNPTATPTTNPTAQPPQSPTASPSPTPSVPEFPIWIAIFLVVGATSLLVALKKKQSSR